MDQNVDPTHPVPAPPDLAGNIIDVEEEEQNRNRKRQHDEISKRPVPKNFAKLRSNVYTHYSWVDYLRQWKCNHCS